MQNWVKRGQEGGHVTYFWNFGTPSISRKRLELGTPNFACRFTDRGINERNAKLGQKGSGGGHVAYFWNFGIPSISRERLELETSNLACWFIARSTNERNAKLGQKGSGRGSRDLLLKFWDPLHISGTVRARNAKLCMQIQHQGY